MIYVAEERVEYCFIVAHPQLIFLIQFMRLIYIDVVLIYDIYCFFLKLYHIKMVIF